MELLDNDVVIADVTETLSGGFPSGEEESFWRLSFNENADGTDNHTFLEDHTMKVRMVTDGGQVNVDYRGGDAHVEFWTNQIVDEEFHVQDVHGNDKFGMEFIPKYPEESGLGIAHIWGSFMDSFTYRDIENIQITIEGPDDMFYPDPIAPEHQSSDDSVAFHFNWSYGEDMHGEEDAGTYYVTFEIIDQTGNNFTYVDEVRFILSKYGVYLVLADDESDTKSGSAGSYVHFEMVVYNAGLVNDTIEFTHNDLPREWEAGIDPEQVILNSEEFHTILLNVSIPEDAVVGESVDVYAIGTSKKSQSDPEYQEASWSRKTTTRVTGFASVTLSYREQDSDNDGSTYVDDRHKEGNAERGGTRISFSE